MLIALWLKDIDVFLSLNKLICKLAFFILCCYSRFMKDLAVQNIFTCFYMVYSIDFLVTKVMFILSSVSRGLEFWSVNHTSIYKNSESKVFKNLKFLGEIYNNCPMIY